MGQVPYPKVADLPPEAQVQLQRNFEAAVLVMETGGGRVKVPYTKIAGLPPEAQRQIQRNFEDLTCTGGGAVDNSLPTGTVVTSDEYVRATTGLTINGTSQDLYAGGSVFPWSVKAGSATIDDLGGSGWVVTPGSGSFRCIAATDQPNVVVEGIERGGAHPAGRIAGVIARYLDDSNYVYADYTAGGTPNVSYGRILAGVQTVYGSITAAASTLRLQVSGFSISVFSGATILGTTIDRDVPTGTGTGISTFNAVELQSFKVTTV